MLIFVPLEKQKVPIKKTGLIITALFLAAATSAQTFFFADISREEIYSYTFNKKGIRDSSLSEVCWYDTAGNLVERRRGRTATKYSNTYYTSGRLLKQISSK